MEWINTVYELPRENVLVETRIHDGHGIRNTGTLKRIGNLWFIQDGTTYVYYVPTEWRYFDNSKSDWKIELTD